MHKILLIIKREYFSRVKKKSFLLMTFLIPIFFIAIYAGMFFLMKKGIENNFSTITVIDQEGTIFPNLVSNKNVAFVQSTATIEQEKEKLSASSNDQEALLVIPPNIYETNQVDLLSAGKANIKTKVVIESQLESVIRNKKYEDAGIDKMIVQSIDPKIQITAKEVSEDGTEKNANTEIAIGISMGLSILIFISLLLYGTQVMRGVVEEKSNRIIEVIISSVKPFQLMMGKIIGIGMVGLTQFVLWIVLTFGLLTLATTVLFSQDTMQDVTAMQQELNAGSSPMNQAIERSQQNDILEAINSINFAEIAICFILFFVASYLMYSALFAAVGSAVDSETEANQFSMPITMPLLITYMLSFGLIMVDPHGTISTWLSFIPLTSPIAMLVRIPFGVPLWQIILSLSLLIVSFIFTTWLASRIYRVGILMYGKKPSLKELIKWFNYKG